MQKRILQCQAVLERSGKALLEARMSGFARELDCEGGRMSIGCNNRGKCPLFRVNLRSYSRESAPCVGRGFLFIRM
jgi:hypothetical protein